MKMEDYYLVSIVGADKKGLCAKVTEIFAKNKINIIDAEETVMRGYFIMHFLVDCRNVQSNKLKKISKSLKKIADELNVEMNIRKHNEKEHSKRNIFYITTLGKDRPGIIYEFSKLFSSLNLNIERMQMIVRGDISVTEYMVSFPSSISFRDAKAKIYEKANEIGFDAIIQSRNFFNRDKKLVVFDLDGTLIEKEMIDEIAKEVSKKVDIKKEISKITSDAMNGKIEFKTALRKRVELLKNTDINILENMAKNIELGPEASELIYRLKELGYKIAIISGGFKIFTDALKEKYPIDYAFANELEVVDRKLTGKIKGRIIDAKEKARLMKEISKKEKISLNDVIAIGDGANDRIMIKNAGLGIAFNPKEILKKFSNGVLTRENFIGLLYCLGDYKKMKNIN